MLYKTVSIVSGLLDFNFVDGRRRAYLNLIYLTLDYLACKKLLALPPYGIVTASSERKTGRACAAEDGFILSNTGWCAKNDDGKRNVSKQCCIDYQQIMYNDYYYSFHIDY